MQGGAAYTLTYKLDGSESKNTTPGRQGGAGTESVAKAAWENNTIVINITQTMNTGPSMTVQGKQVVSHRRWHHGCRNDESGHDGTPTTTKTTYKKN
jgi:hypothetical protein